MRLFLLLTLLQLFNAIPSYGQTLDPRWDFLERIVVRLNELPVSNCQEPSGKTAGTKTPSTTSCCDPESRWRLESEYQYSWEEIVGQQAESEAHCFSLEPAIFSYAELATGLDIGPSPGSGNLFLLDRNHPGNRSWFAEHSGTNLVLRYVHNYPDGNMTSFYREIRLYFTRVE